MNGLSACEALFHTKQAMYHSPISDLNPKFDEDQLFSMTLQCKGEMRRCMTIARSLQEAETRARNEYGRWFLLDTWGVRRLPLESRLMGGGHFLRSSRDEHHTHSLTLINSIR